MSNIISKIIGIICAALVATGQGTAPATQPAINNVNTAQTSVVTQTASKDTVNTEILNDSIPEYKEVETIGNKEPDYHISKINPVYTDKPKKSGTTNAALAKQAFDLINDYRVKNGRNALTWSADDAAVAEIRARELVTDYSHNSASGTVSDGENIGKSTAPSASEIVDAWIASPGHKQNILRSGYISAGLAVYEENGTYYWSNNFTSSHECPNEGDENTTTRTLDDGTRVTTDGDGNMTVVFGNPATDKDGWAMGHIELLGTDLSKDTEIYSFIIYADTGIWSYIDSICYDIDEETGKKTRREHDCHGLIANVEDIMSNRAVKINMNTDEIKWA